MLKNYIVNTALWIQFTTLACLLCAHPADALEVGDQICIQGFIMDYFCIRNGNMIDNGRVTLEEPERHTVHCLVDVGICLETAFEVLVESSSGSTAYSRGYRLDDDSKSDILSLARSVGSCSTCVNGYDNSMLGTGFKAVMKVTVLDLNPDDAQGSPPLVRVDERKDSSSLGNDPCQSEYGMIEGDGNAPPPTAADTTAPVSSPTTSAYSPGDDKDGADSGMGINLFWTATIAALSSLHAVMML